jgi:hypothetical protein
MQKGVIHGLVFIQTWGDSSDLLRILMHNRHVISIFHIMGRHSYLIDVNFDDKDQLEEWIGQIKSLKLSSGVPAVIAIQSNKVIDVCKQKEDFTLSNYNELKGGNHMFMMIDNPHGDDALIGALKTYPEVHTILHVQGEHSFIIEILTDEYDRYREILKRLKLIESVWRIETQEVINVPKYRNHILDQSGKLVKPQEDIRELYVL